MLHDSCLKHGVFVKNLKKIYKFLTLDFYPQALWTPRMHNSHLGNPGVHRAHFWCLGFVIPNFDMVVSLEIEVSIKILLASRDTKKIPRNHKSATIPTEVPKGIISQLGDCGRPQKSHSEFVEKFENQNPKIFRRGRKIFPFNLGWDCFRSAKNITTVPARRAGTATTWPSKRARNWSEVCEVHFSRKMPLFCSDNPRIATSLPGDKLLNFWSNPYVARNTLR